MYEDLFGDDDAVYDDVFVVGDGGGFVITAPGGTVTDTSLDAREKQLEGGGDSCC
jgi:hypothetical protein